MTSRVIWTLSALAIAASVQLPAQTNRELAWTAQTPWGDPELQGEWTQ